MYNATKYATRGKVSHENPLRINAHVEGLGISESLHQELAPLGLRSICIEPGYFKTDLLTTDNRAPFHSKISDYESVTSATHEILVSKY